MIKYDNCKDCTSQCEYAGKDRECVCMKGVSCKKVGEPDMGNVSDGYHTFNELYHHRAVLFACLVNSHPRYSWKSKRHHDGSMFDGMFIVGMNTPFGQVTYHYDVEPYWNLFHCRALERAPEWDGHTADQAAERLRKWAENPWG